MELQTFNFESQEVRTVIKNNEPWFIGNDLAEVLGYRNKSDALQKHIDKEDKDEIAIRDSIGRMQNTPIVNESGMYALIFGSKLPKAKEFKRWVTNEVLPAIRKQGIYLTDKKAFDITHNPNSLADLLVQAGEQLKQKDLVIKEMQPKVIFADAVEASHTTILVGDLAKLLRQNGIEIGQNRLFEWLRNNGYLIGRKGDSWNSPTQYAMDRGWFEVKERTHQEANGSVRITRTTKVTGKGQQYFINKFLNEGVI